MAKARSLNFLRTPGGGFPGAGCLVPGYRRSIVREEAKLSGVGGQTRDRSVEGPATSLVHRKITRLALMLGQAVRDERVRRRLTVREMTAAAGLGRGTVSEPPARPRRATTRATEWHDRRMICEATPPRARLRKHPRFAVFGAIAIILAVGAGTADLTRGYIDEGDSTVTTGRYAGGGRSQPGRIRAAGRNASASTSPLSGRPPGSPE